MKAAILIEIKKPLLVAEVDLPKKLEFGQVLVKVYYSGICGAQINEIDAVKGPDKFLPHLLGHEGSGIVQDVGPGVTTVKKNDHVVLHWRKSSGAQSQTPNYTWNKKKINAGRITTFNEYAVVSENRLTSISKKFDLKTAALFGCVITSGFGAVNNDAKVKIGQSVLIYGLGGMGLSIADACSMVSANPIVGIDIHESKLELSKKFGVTETIINKNNDYVKKKISEIFGEKGPEVVFETTGNSKLMEHAYEITPNDGKTVYVGVPNDKISIYSLPLAFDKKIEVSHGGDATPDKEIPRYINLSRDKGIDFSKFITHEFHLNEVNEALNLFRTGKAGRIILKISEEN